MSTQEYILELRNKVDIIASGKLIGIAAQDTHVKMVERIFEDGRAANDAEIGSYDTKKPLYVNPKNAPRNFPTIGKNDDAKFDDGTPHKTAYFDSYKSYREKVGRQTGKVDLTMFGNLKSDFGKAVIKKDGLTWVSTTTRNQHEKIIEGQEKRFGNIFRLTPKERDNFKQVLAFETFNILR